MKVLLLSPDINSKEDIKSFSSNYAYHTKRVLSSYPDVEITVLPHGGSNGRINHSLDFFVKNDIGKYDVIIGMGIRYFSMLDRKVISGMRDIMKKGSLLCQIYDSNSRKKDPVDFNFYLIKSPESGNGCHIDWSADNTLFYPEQSEDTFTILIDHPHYVINNVDEMSDQIAKMCHDFSKNKDLLSSLNRKYGKKFNKVAVYRLVSNGIEEVTLGKTVNNNYNRVSANQCTLASFYRKSHVFICTHRESVGLSVLESAMSGCLVISPLDFIKKERLSYVNHYEFNESIDWDLVFSKINPDDSSKKVSKYTWEKSIGIMYDKIKTRLSDNG